MECEANPEGKKAKPPPRAMKSSEQLAGSDEQEAGIKEI